MIQEWSFKEIVRNICVQLHNALLFLQEEDDGVILLQCIDSIDEKKAYLLILDAGNMTELCRATVQSRATVPMPLHGHFVPSA